MSAKRSAFTRCFVCGVNGQLTVRMSACRKTCSSPTNSMPSSAAMLASANGSCAMKRISSGLHTLNISAPILPIPIDPSVLPTRPIPICWPRRLKPSGPSRVNWSLIINLPVNARMRVKIETATGRLTPSGVITSAISAFVQASTSTLS